MKNEEEILIAWTLSDLIARLNDLLWERYDKEFIERYIKLEEEKYWESLSDKDFPSDI